MQNTNDHWRKGKENLYIEKMTELQRIWGNPIDSDWEFVKERADAELEKDIKETIGQLRFEKGMRILKVVLLVVALAVIVSFLA